MTPAAVVNRASEQSFPVTPLAAAQQAIIDAGGLSPYARAKLLEQHRMATG